MKFSFSRLNSFENCPYAWYLQYLLVDESGVPIYDVDSNFYSDFGSLCHEILEKIVTGEIHPDDAPVYFLKNFSKISDIPEGSWEEFQNSGYWFFSDLDLSWLNQYEILGAEKKFEFEVGDIPFVAFVDLLLRDKNTGEIILVDYKTSGYPFNKNGTVKKKKEQSFLSYKRQLYIYSKPIQREYGKFPSFLRWYFLRDRKWVEIPFDIKEYEEAMTWAENTYRKIAQEEDFDPNEDWFFCHKICSFRRSCEYVLV